MKYIILVVTGFLAISTHVCAGDVQVRGYTRQDGTQVQGYHRTTQDSTVNNNYGTQGNTNPYTNIEGTQHRRVDQPQGNYNTGNGYTSGQYSTHQRRHR